MESQVAFQAKTPATFSIELGPRIWIGVKTDPFSGKFVTQAGLELDERIADWALGEPGSGDCVVADR